MDKETERQIRKMFYASPNGWKLCSSKADEVFTSKFKQIVLDKLGNHPLGDYEYIDDCACMLNWGLDSDSCGCECHKEVDYYISELKQILGGKDSLKSDNETEHFLKCKKPDCKRCWTEIERLASGK